MVTINSSDSAKCLNNILQSLLEESFMERNGKLLTNDCFKVTLTVCNADILVCTFLICAFLSFICYRIPWRYMYAYSIVNCLCLKFPAHYRSRFKEMGTHLHKEPQGWSLCVLQPGDSYQLLQSYFARIRLKPISQPRSPWPIGNGARLPQLGHPTCFFHYFPLRAQNSLFCNITMTTQQVYTFT